MIVRNGDTKHVTLVPAIQVKGGIATVASTVTYVTKSHRYALAIPDQYFYEYQQYSHVTARTGGMKYLLSEDH